MSDLKHQTVEELKQSKIKCQKYIDKLSSQLSGQKERMKWIDSYLYTKTPQELSIKQIEAKLGHRIIIKGK